MYGIFNQKGFILPLTMMLSFLFPLIIISELEMYKIEQRFFLEEEEIEKLDNLTQIGIQDLFDLVREQPIEEKIVGTLSYPIGYITYSVELLELNVVLISGKCFTNSDRNQFFHAIVNLETEEIEKWVEE